MKFCLDRFEGRVAVCLCEDEDAVQPQYDVSLEDVPALAALSQGDIFEAGVDATGRLQDVTLLEEETRARRASAQARLQALFSRNKNKG